MSKSSTTECGEIGGGDDDKKMSTSYEQKSKIGGGKGSSSDIDTGSSGKVASDNIDLLSKKLSDNSIGSMTISDDELFKDPPPKEDCQICFLPMPFTSGVCGINPIYNTCCGKILCSGCLLTSIEEMKRGNLKTRCPYCRVLTPDSSKEEEVSRCEKRMKLNDAVAFHTMGKKYENGHWRLSKDLNKALELHNQAAELGHPDAHFSMGIAYHGGYGIEKDMSKAVHHYKLASIGGHERARHMLGCLDLSTGNIDCIKHFIIAAKSGYEESMKKVEEVYKAGLVEKDEYASTLSAYQVSVDEMESDQRSKAMKWQPPKNLTL